jgi:thiamine-phosphate pyrophosphorylase
LFELVKDAVSISRESETLLVVNDRTDIALAAGADGVHLATTSLSAKVLRQFIPNGFLVGVSTHDLAELFAAVNDGADIAVFGPVFDTPGKSRHGGIQVLKHACESVKPFPILALGGVDGSNWRQVIEAGAAGFAAIRSLNDSASLRSIMQAVKG